MLRFGKGLTLTLKAAAKLNATYGRGTEFLCETSAQQTLLQKAIRQMQRARVKREWDVLRRVTKPFSDEAMQAYCEKRWPHIYKVDDKND